MRKITEGELEMLLASARAMGREAGVNAASWVIQDTWGGHVTRGAREIALKFLYGHDDGDPVIMDQFSPPNLSGEWAGDLTERSLAESLGVDPESDPHGVIIPEIADAWEWAANEAYYDELIKSARETAFEK